MKQEQKLIDAMLSARKKGLRIVRGFAFDDSSGNLVSCGVIGSVLLTLGKTNFYDGWLKDVCSELDCDSFWLYRLIMGFDRNYQIMVGIPDKNGDVKKYIKDDVSFLGIQLAKKYTINLELKGTSQ